MSICFHRHRSRNVAVADAMGGELERDRVWGSSDEARSHLLEVVMFVAMLMEMMIVVVVALVAV